MSATLLRLPLLKPVAPQPGPRPGVDYPQSKQSLVDLGARCWECPLVKMRPVRTEWYGGAVQPTLALVGEAPGRREAATNRPFVGASGKLLNYACAQAGVPRGDLAILNGIACGPIPSEADAIKASAAKACRPRLLAELRALRPKGVLAVGAYALRTLAPEGTSGITALRGARLKLASDVVGAATWNPSFFSTFHPAHIMRGGDGEDESDSSVDLLYYFLLFDLGKAYRFAKGEIAPWSIDADLFVVRDGALHRARVDDDGVPSTGFRADEDELYEAITRVRDEADARGELACDVETDSKDSLEAKLTAIAYATPSGGVSATWEAWRLFPRVFDVLRALHADRHRRWVWQNGIYDRVVFGRHNLRVQGPSEDTLLKHHAAFPGLPHRLDQMATQFFVVPPWKNEFRSSTRDPAELVFYNCLHHDTRVLLADGTTETIAKLVQSHSQAAVLSLGPYGIEAKRIVGWPRTRVPTQEWLRLRTTATPTWSRGLILTPDHKVYTRRGKIEAQDLQLTDEVATSEIEFSPDEFAALRGTLLGDTALVASPTFRRRITEAPSLALSGSHRDDTGYAQYKCEVFHRVAFLGKAKRASGFASDGLTRLWWTRNLQQLRALYPEFYGCKGRRRLRVETLERLGPIGLAWWFMDDGCLQKGQNGPQGDSITIAACRYPRSDVDAAVAWFRKRYGATTAGRDKVIRIGIRACRKLCGEIACHVIPALRYKLPRWLRADVFLRTRERGPLPLYAPVLSVERVALPQKTKEQRLKAETRYCLTVEDNHNFFTTTGLVANCQDAIVTAKLSPALDKHIAAVKVTRVYEADRQQNVIATYMREVGMYIDRDEQKRHSLIQHARFDYMQGELTKDFKAIEEPWRQALSRQLADKQRKKDPDSYMERVEMRYREIAERERKPTDVGLFKPKAKADIVALFNILRIPVTDYTKKGAPITDKRAMEAAAGLHPLMRRLIHLREAQHLIATYIDGLPVKHDGRMHPDWKTNKITGRWGAGKSMNVPQNVAGWPPKTDEHGNFKANKNGSLITPRENPRSIITAPTAAQVIEVHARGARVHPIVLARAKQGRGRMLVGADEDQVELRIVGFLAREPFLINIFNKGLDPHAEFARVIFPNHFPQLEKAIAEAGFKPKTDLGDHITRAQAAIDGAPHDIARARLRAPLEALKEIVERQREWKRIRDLSKRVEYGSIYKGKAPTLWESIVKDFPEVTLTDVEKMIHLIESAMPCVVGWWGECETYARINREIRERVLGRVRLFPLGNFNPNIVVNYPVQAYNAGLMAKGMFRFVALTQPHLLEFAPLYRMGLLDARWVAEWRDRGFARWRAPVDLVSQVHDSLLAECDEEDAPRVVEMMTACLTQEAIDERHGIKMPYTAEAKAARRWSKS